MLTFAAKLTASAEQIVFEMMSYENVRHTSADVLCMGLFVGETRSPTTVLHFDGLLPLAVGVHGRVFARRGNAQFRFCC